MDVPGSKLPASPAPDRLREVARILAEAILRQKLRQGRHSGPVSRQRNSQRIPLEVVAPPSAHGVEASRNGEG